MNVKHCRHCGREIVPTLAATTHWLHRDTGSIFCDASATQTRTAAPR